MNTLSKSLSLLLFFFFSSQAFSLDSQIYRPLNPSQGGFNLYTADEFLKGRWTVGVYYNFDKHPLEFGDASTNKIDDVVNDLHTTNFILSYEISNRMALNIDVPYHFISDFEPIDSAVRTADEVIGDISITAPVRLGCTKGGFCFKAIPQVLIDSGEEDAFLGLLDPAFGLGLAVDKTFRSTKLIFNADYRKRKKEQVFNLILNDSITMGLGAIKDIGKPKGFMLIGEAKLELPVGGVDQETINSPAEVFGGVRYLSCKKRLSANLGYSKGLNKGYGSPDYRIFGGLSFALGGKPQSGCEDGLIVSQAVAIEESIPVVVPEGKISFSDVAPVIIKLKKINFYSGSAIISPASIPTVNKLAKTLKANPEIQLLSIEGHTDSAGSKTLNTNLSKKRAASVKKFLIGMGVEEAKLATQGFGPDKPVATNATKEGRAKNRRVEFKALKVEGGSLQIEIE